MKNRKGFDAGGYRYRVDYRAGPEWKTLLDASEGRTDLFVDYRETPRVLAKELRIVVLSAPEGVMPGITEFTVFGE